MTDPGRAFESEAKIILEEAKVFKDKVSDTLGSGSVRGDSDLHARGFFVECKVKSTVKGVSFTKKELDKLDESVRLHSSFGGLGVIKNADGKVHVVMKIEDFCNLLNMAWDYGHKKGEEEEQED
jgi:hypothetical protein